ncbi:hypothetical protein SLEP1_g1893 [Rubroshorea leprosula]|uniref:Protein kinase domain-containing protein n=1 Tax=Rubroshorea leprosula TaxID=152421 RepID=A0AAV5HL69_9ROSI|nr:hypothetical protein SLEP1_g1893 [Rubroshorea leprosula]
MWPFQHLAGDKSSDLEVKWWGPGGLRSPPGHPMSDQVWSNDVWPLHPDVERHHSHCGSCELGIFGIIVAVCWYCVKKLRKALPEILSEVKTATVTTSRQPQHVVPIWEVDAPTMGKFLQEFAKDKPVRFTAQQLCAFTGNHSTRLGSGGFGVVYRGQFPNGVKIAVKVLEKGSETAAGEQFMAEVGTIGKTYHINLVRLYGFCYDQYMSALVYEFMENGSLDKYLFGEKEMTGWEKLHEIAPGNVLLDEKFFPKVAEFGLATLCNRDSTHVSITGYRGTPGYSAPQFLLRNHPITYNYDVYSFGMVLFEIAGRRKNTVISYSESLDWFPKHVWEKYEKGELTEMTVDCGIEEKDREKTERMSVIALWCVQDSPEARPPMNAVVKMLAGGVEIKPPPKPFHYLFSVVSRDECSQANCWFKFLLK